MRVNTKGQIVIPVELRKKYGIKPGDEVEFRPENARLILVKTGVKAALKKWAGKGFRFPKGIQNTDKFIEAIRGR